MDQKPAEEAPKKANGYVTKTEIARRTGVSRQTVTKYFAEPGGPEPDLDGKFEPIAAGYYVGICHARTIESPAIIRMRERKMEIELAQLERAEALERRELIPKKTIQPGIAAVMTRLTADLVDVFERELPPKYQGRSAVDCAGLNANGVDRVLIRFKEGAAPLTGKA